MKQIILILLLFITGLSAKPVKFAIGEWNPYVGEALEGYGPTTKVVRHACEQAGLECEFEFHPWKRSIEMAIRNYDDTLATFPWVQTARRDDMMFPIRTPVLKTEQVVFYRKGKFPENWTVDFEKLVDQRVAVIRGYLTGDMLVEKGITPHIVSSAETAWKMIALNRIDFFLDSKQVGLSECHKFSPGVCAQITTSKPYEYDHLIIYFTRANENSKRIKEALETALSNMQSNGKIEKIYRESYRQ